MYRQTTPGDRWLAIGLGLVAGGAIGNLLDRIRSERGVVDFIDIGVGSHRFWIFNVADMGVVIGAGLLAFLLWRRDRNLTEPTGA
jgi:signal peptidase II